MWSSAVRAPPGTAETAGGPGVFLFFLLLFFLMNVSC